MQRVFTVSPTHVLRLPLSIPGASLATRTFSASALRPARIDWELKLREKAKERKMSELKKIFSKEAPPSKFNLCLGCQGGVEEEGEKDEMGIRLK
jgi:hypothetical protein